MVSMRVSVRAELASPELVEGSKHQRHYRSPKWIGRQEAWKAYGWHRTCLQWVLMGLLAFVVIGLMRQIGDLRLQRRRSA